jgi:hypothetical protein
MIDEFTKEYQKKLMEEYRCPVPYRGRRPNIWRKAMSDYTLKVKKKETILTFD